MRKLFERIYRLFAPKPPQNIDDLINQPWSPEASLEVDRWIIESESKKHPLDT